MPKKPTQQNRSAAGSLAEEIMDDLGIDIKKMTETAVKEYMKE